jgi:hypothetical protein
MNCHVINQYCDIMEYILLSVLSTLETLFLKEAVISSIGCHLPLQPVCVLLLWFVN